MVVTRDIVNVSSCRNGTDVTSRLKLNYTMYCNYTTSRDYTWHIKDDIRTTFEDCLDFCDGNGVGCYGVIWNSARRCFLKRQLDLKTDVVVIDEANIMGIPLASQMRQDPKTVACPYPNLSIHTLSNGLGFQILCGAELGGGDFVNQRAHTESMEECLQLCAEAHPLCSRVKYGADRDRGWRNCYLKTLGTGRPTARTATFEHSAYALFQPPANFSKTCKQDEEQTSTNGKTFQVSCQDYRNVLSPDLPPLHNFHAPEYGVCMEKCATTFESNCIAFSFDSGLQAGYQNCYLFDGIPSILQRNGNHTFSYLPSAVDASVPFETPPPFPPSKTPNKHLAYLTFLVILPIIGVVLYCRARKKKKLGQANYEAVNHKQD